MRCLLHKINPAHSLNTRQSSTENSPTQHHYGAIAKSIWEKSEFPTNR